jgi:hypothetical protein
MFPALLLLSRDRKADQQVCIVVFASIQFAFFNRSFVFNNGSNTTEAERRPKKKKPFRFERLFLDKYNYRRFI